jgi:hypothetical protein
MARWRFVDDLTGKIGWSDDAAEDWDGSTRHRKNLDGQHPDLKEKRLPSDKEPAWFTPEPRMAAIVTATTVTAYGDVSFYTDVNGRTTPGPRG